MLGTFDLSTLNGQNGLTFMGATIDNQSGQPVSNIGDINADGIIDFAIGNFKASPGGKAQAGATYVVFGNPSIRGINHFNLSSLNGSNGFVIPGLTASDQSGYAVSGVGDINTDGIADFIIGAPTATPSGRTQAGTSYVIFGNSGIGSTGLFDLSTLDGTNGFIIPSLTNFGASGYALSGAGDTNGDGIEDMLIGAYGVSPGGVCYVVFGKSGIGNTGTFALSTLDGTNGFSIPGIVAGSQAGASVSSAGDVNNDGLADILVGAAYANGGFAYVVFGKSGSRSSGTFDLSTLNGANGFALPGLQAGDRCGNSVSTLGDVNEDGIADIIIGAPFASPSGFSFEGIAYVIFGNSGIGNTGTFDLSTTLNGNNGYWLSGFAARQGTGIFVSGAGDFNGDGIQDMFVGQRSIIFGKSFRGNSGTFDLTTFNGTNGYALTSSVSTAAFGDINDDGVTDILLGVGQENVGEADKTYLIFGNRRPPAIVTNQLTLNQNEIHVFNISNLNATDVIYTADSLSFTVTQVQHGQFKLVSNGNSMTSFTQNQVRNNAIQFVHDGTVNAPQYSISVSNLSPIPSFPQPASISFNAAPVLVNNSLTLRRGETVILGSRNLAATDVDDLSANLIFTVSQLQHGQFSLVNQPGASIYSFLQNQITLHQVQFTHDGGGVAPAYDVSVSDRRVSNFGGPSLSVFFDAGNPNIITNSSNSTPAIVGGIVGASVGVIALTSLSAIYTRNRAKQTLEQAIEDKRES